MPVKKSKRVLDLEAQVLDLTTKLEDTEAKLAQAEMELATLRAAKSSARPTTPKAPFTREQRAAHVERLVHERGLSALPVTQNVWVVADKHGLPCAALDYWQSGQHAGTWSATGKALQEPCRGQLETLLDQIGEPEASTLEEATSKS